MKKVSFITHLASFNQYGGVETQLKNIYNNINEKSSDYKAKLFNMWEDDILDCDILHVFNPFFMGFELDFLLNKIKNSDTKLVVYPVFTFHPGASKVGSSLPFLRIFEEIFLKMRMKLRSNQMFSYFDPFSHIHSLLENSDMIIVQNEIERNNINKFFNLPNNLFHTVHNGIDMMFKDGDPKLFRDEIGEEDYILFVGRIEPIKNVESLIRAYVKSDLPAKLVIVGKESDQDYFKRCLEQANKDVIFHTHMPYGSPLHLSVYAGARVFALPSRFEICGMAGLEAGLAGANVVVTSNGGTREYYKDYATYADPYDIDSITDALIKAYNSPRNGDLARHVEKNYSWDVITSEVISAYDSLFE